MNDLIKATCLRIGEVAAIVGVSRVTVYKWCKGTNPHYLLRRRVSNFRGVVGDMMANNELPFPVDIDETERKRKVEDIRAKVATYSQ